ncbi:MAG: thiol reductase thioredoxin [Bacteroidales bacterium]|nr:thiol reductase thioredoxin [Bacteroidales bacterium]
MNKLIILILSITLMTLQSCKGQKGEPALQNPADSSNGSVAMIQNAEGDQNVAPIHITKAEFLKFIMDYEKNTAEWVYEGELPCIVDFYADWCPPCKISDPILEELAGEYAGRINIYKVDVDVEQELASVFGIQSIPTFLFCPMEGNPTISSGIAQTPEETRILFRRQIEEILFNSSLSAL